MPTDTPEAVQFRLTIAGGVNPHGEPNFRVVHGSKAIDIVDGVAMRRYLPVNNWHLTAWIPPEKNPPRGGYEHCYALGTELYPGLVEKLIDMIKKSRDFTLIERYNAIMAREEKAERDYVEEDYAILDDGVRAFHQQPFIVKP
jgi:hypothetical protein